MLNNFQHTNTLLHERSRDTANINTNTISCVVFLHHFTNTRKTVHLSDKKQICESQVLLHLWSDDAIPECTKGVQCCSYSTRVPVCSNNRGKGHQAKRIANANSGPLQTNKQTVFNRVAQWLLTFKLFFQMVRVLSSLEYSVIDYVSTLLYVLPRHLYLVLNYLCNCWVLLHLLHSFIDSIF